MAILTGTLPSRKLIPSSFIPLLKNGLRNTGGQRIPVTSDADGTLVPSGQIMDFSDGNHPFLRLLRNDVPVVIVSHSPFEAERDDTPPFKSLKVRIANPAREALVRTGERNKMQNLWFYADGGPDRLNFDAEGNEYIPSGCEEFRKQFLISDADVLERCLDFALSVILGKKEYSKIKKGLKFDVSDFKVRVKPIESSFNLRAWVSMMTMSILDPVQLSAVDIAPSGTTTIHAVSSNLVKGVSVMDVLRRLELPEDTPVPCLGDESVDRVVRTKLIGEITFTASDITFLARSPNTHLLAVTANQEAVVKMQNPRIHPAGIGIEAVNAWLNLFAQAAESPALVRAWLESF